MSKPVIGAACLVLLLTAACENMTTDEQMIFGGLAGATVGVVGAEALDANTNWTILAALAGAAVGTLVARNNRTQQCAYARGDGTYYVRPCP
ncbi:glucose-6-phosphate isomerase [Halovulum dunhuangense]|uniref:17 kDa surface antigen n=1 Tax=Halovulum dunhuangense TaxID=1505036 RepID=A0A849L5X0_9RHOB|nr:glycine zipper 2TM domain-containing protein [Halovulum dunhuangense]NNU81507.1 glucose-6-phosphate isomerase [Halovulum dunhuangense]